MEDVQVNSRLTLGENVADLGGELLAYMAWKDATRDRKLTATDGFTPEQRFFIGFAQWACGDERAESKRVHAITDPHSPAEYRVNGVVANMPEFATAFACKVGQPMVRTSRAGCGEVGGDAAGLETRCRRGRPPHKNRSIVSFDAAVQYRNSRHCLTATCN